MIDAQLPPESEQALRDRLQAWLGAQPESVADSLRVQRIELMLRRMAGQPPAVQIALGRRARKAIDELARAPVSEVETAPPQGHTASPRKPSLLAELPAYLESRSRPPASQDPFEAETVSSEMKSVRRFSEVWSRIAAETQVKQAVVRGPENAGPLNSHMLMLRSLTLMQELSTDYLRRFLSEMDTLLWLEQMNQKHALPDRKAARATRSRK